MSDLHAAQRIRGAVLGAAIGDALGHPTEFYRGAAIRERWGTEGVQGFELWWERTGEGRFAPYTDDTQMAEIVLRELVDHGGASADLDALMSAIGRGFAEWRIAPQGGHRAPGNACMAGAKRLAEGANWRSAGSPDAGGCGSVMRAYPFGLLLAGEPDRAEAWAVEHSRLTHRHPIAFAACAAMACGMASEMAGFAPDAVLSAMVEAAGRHDATTAAMIERAMADADADEPPAEVLDRLEGWAAHEAVAAAVYVVARHPADFRAAAIEGANASGDSDSIATLAGAILGARLGVDAIPGDWVRDVERSPELLALANAAARHVTG